MVGDREKVVRVSIIILNFNAKRFLGDCLSSIYESKKVFDDFEVILVDNASVDGSVEYVRKFFPQVEVIENQENLGFAKGNNVGIRHSRGDYIVLLNPDTVVTPGWLLELIRVAESDDRIGIVGPKTLRFDGRTIDTTGHIFHHKLGDAENRGSGEVDCGQYDDETDVLSVQFSCALIKREVMDYVGLLDEKMFLYVEDVDYGVRTRLCGWKVAYCPKSVVYHYYGGSTPRMDWRIRRYGVTFRLRLILKNYSFLNMVKWGAFSVGICFLGMLNNIRNRMFLYFFYPLWWNALNFPVKERIEIQRKRVKSDSTIFKYSVKGKW